jgi:hypothetical protein
MKFMPVALLAATASAFAPTRLNNNGIHKTQQPHLCLLPNPEIVSLVTDSAFSSSSITTSNFIDSLVSNVAGLVLIAGVGAGVYSTALQEKQQELQKQLEELFDKETADDFTVPVAEEPKVVSFVMTVFLFFICPSMCSLFFVFISLTRIKTISGQRSKRSSYSNSRRTSG